MTESKFTAVEPKKPRENVLKRGILPEEQYVVQQGQDAANANAALQKARDDVKKNGAKADPKLIEAALRAAKFDEPSVRLLMEQNPRLALVAAEAKISYDTDDHHFALDNSKPPKVIGHKSFQISLDGGFRTIGKQEAAKASGNSQATGGVGNSAHQHGEGIDFTIMEPDGKGNMAAINELTLPRKYPYMSEKDPKTGNWKKVPDANPKQGGAEDYQHAAWWFARVLKRDYNVKSALAGDYPEEKNLNKGWAEDNRIRLYQPGGTNGAGYDWRHVQLPGVRDLSEGPGEMGLNKQFAEEWERNFRDGRVILNGETQPNSWIDPALHPEEGPQYKPAPPKPQAKPKPKAPGHQ